MKMSNSELLEYNKNRVICQICLAVKKPILDVLDEWVDKLKVGPWTVITLSDETVEGAMMGDDEILEPFKFYCALAMYGNIQIEIVQREYGPFFAQSYIDRCGGGLQHFKEKFLDDKLESAAEELESVGFKRTFWGGFKEDRFINFDSEASLGFSIELGNFADITLPEDTYFTYPRED